MVDLALGALFLLLLIAMASMIMALRRHVTLRQHPRQHPDAPWRLVEHPRAITNGGPGAYAVYVMHPDEEPQLVDAVYWDDPDFEGKLEEIRCQGAIRLAALNSQRKRLR